MSDDRCASPWSRRAWAARNRAQPKPLSGGQDRHRRSAVEVVDYNQLDSRPRSCAGGTESPRWKLCASRGRDARHPCVPAEAGGLGPVRGNKPAGESPAGRTVVLARARLRARFFFAQPVSAEPAGQGRTILPSSTFTRSPLETPGCASSTTTRYRPSSRRTITSQLWLTEGTSRPIFVEEPTCGEPRPAESMATSPEGFDSFWSDGRCLPGDGADGSDYTAFGAGHARRRRLHGIAGACAPASGAASIKSTVSQDLISPPRC